MSKMIRIAPAATKKVAMNPMVPGLYQVCDGSTEGDGLGVAASNVKNRFCIT